MNQSIKYFITLFVTSFILLIIGCGGGGSGSLSSSINLAEYLYPNKNITNLYSEHIVESDGYIGLRTDRKVKYSKTGNTVKEESLDGSGLHTQYTEDDQNILIQEYENDTLTDSYTIQKIVNIDDSIDLFIDSKKINCKYDSHLNSYLVDAQRFADVIRFTCSSNPKIKLFFAKNTGPIYAESTLAGNTFKNILIGEVGYSLKTLGHFQISYARSVDIAEEGNATFIGTSTVTAVDTTDPSNIFTLSSSGDGDFLQMQVNHNESLLFAVDYSYFVIMDISNRSFIKELASIKSRGSSRFSISDDETLVVVKDIDGVKLIDISNKSNPLITYKSPNFSDAALSKDGNTLYLLSRSGMELTLLDISTPSNPENINLYSGLPSVNSMKLSNSGDTLFLYNYKTLIAIDVSNPNNPKEIFSYDGFGSATVTRRISISDDDKILFITAESTLRVLDISDKNNLRVIGTRTGFWDLGKIREYENKLYVADGSNGLWILEK